MAQTLRGVKEEKPAAADTRAARSANRIMVRLIRGVWCTCYLLGHQALVKKKAGVRVMLESSCVSLGRLGSRKVVTEVMSLLPKKLQWSLRQQKRGPDATRDDGGLNQKTTQSS